MFSSWAICLLGALVFAPSVTGKWILNQATKTFCSSHLCFTVAGLAREAEHDPTMDWIGEE